MKVLPLPLVLSSLFLFGDFIALNGQSYVFTTPVGLAGSNIGADGTNNIARFYNPYGVAAGISNAVFVCDGNALRKISVTGTNWVVTTVAGTNNVPGSVGSSNGTNSVARFSGPNGIATDAGGNLYVADTGNNTIRRVMIVGANYIVTTLAGLPPPALAGSTDGTNQAALFSSPYGIAVGSGTNVFVADTLNSTIRRIVPSGTNWIVTTIAGLAGSTGSLDLSNSFARFNEPAAIAVDTATNLYVADFGNNTIRKLSPSGTNWVASTLAGLAGVIGTVDGTNSTARFNGPQGIAVDGQGNLFVTEAFNNTIRKLTPLGTNWVVTTIGGNAAVIPPGSRDGLGTNAWFNSPFGIALDNSGDLYIADNLNYTIRFGRPAFSLQYALVANQLVLSWPTNASGYVPEFCVAIPPAGSWLAATNPWAPSGANFYMTNGVNGSAAFYRLHKP